MGNIAPTSSVAIQHPVSPASVSAAGGSAFKVMAAAPGRENADSPPGSNNEAVVNCDSPARTAGRIRGVPELMVPGAVPAGVCGQTLYASMREREVVELRKAPEWRRYRM